MPFAPESPEAVQGDIRFWNQKGRHFMQKSMRYHIADGEDQPVVRAVALVVQRESTTSQAPAERPQPVETTQQNQQSKARWFRPALRKAHLTSS